MEFFVYIILLLFGIDFIRKLGLSIYYTGRDMRERFTNPSDAPHSPS